MIRYTIGVSASLITLGVLYDHTLLQRVKDEQIQLIFNFNTRRKSQQFNLGYVTDIYVADGGLQVDIVLRPSVSFFFKSPSDIKLYPVLIGCGSDWRLLRFDVGSE